MVAGSGADMPGLGKGAARGPWNSLLVRHLGQAVQGDGLGSPEPSGQVGPIPVTGWGHTQQCHYCVIRLSFGEMHQGPVQPVLGSSIGHEPPVNEPHHGGHLEEARGHLESCQREQCSQCPQRSASLPTTLGWPQRLTGTSRCGLGDQAIPGRIKPWPQAAYLLWIVKTVLYKHIQQGSTGLALEDG